MVPAKKPFYPGYMENGTIYTLIPLADFKAVLGIDDREDALSRYCLTTATFIIEHYCMRRLLLKKHHETFECPGDYIFPLREYPVREIITINNEQGAMNTGELIGPEFYRVVPDLEGETGERPEDTVYFLSLSPALKRGQGLAAVKAVYRAGYRIEEVPPDLKSACLELAAWNMTRYRGRRIGMIGNVRGNGKDGEHLEISMPENVRQLLEPYKRRMI
jgi:hypothetical protein